MLLLLACLVIISYVSPVALFGYEVGVAYREAFRRPTMVTIVTPIPTPVFDNGLPYVTFEKQNVFTHSQIRKPAQVSFGPSPLSECSPEVLRDFLESMRAVS